MPNKITLCLTIEDDKFIEFFLEYYKFNDYLISYTGNNIPFDKLKIPGQINHKSVQEMIKEFKSDYILLLKDNEFPIIDIQEIIDADQYLINGEPRFLKKQSWNYHNGKYTRIGKNIKKELVKSKILSFNNLFELGKYFYIKKDLKKAKRIFEKSILLNHSSEEVYWSKLYIAKITKESLKYLEAIKHSPDRLEAIYQLSLFCFEKKDYQYAYEYAILGYQLKEPTRYTFNHNPVLYQKTIKEHLIKMSKYNNTLDEIKSVERSFDIKRIAMIQITKKHTEIMGCFLELFQNYQIDIYYNQEDETNYLSYYKDLFEFRVITLEELYKNISLYKLIIMNTAREISLLPKKIINLYQKKIAIVCHNHTESYPGYRTISLNPMLSADYYLLPIYQKNNEINSRKDNVLTIIGLSKNHSYRTKDVGDLFNLLETKKNFKLNIITRKNIILEARLKRYPNVTLYQDLNTIELIRLVKESKFILPLAKTSGYSPYHRNTLTGSIPLAINNNIPMIIDEKLNQYYGLEGNVTYEKSITEVIDFVLSIKENMYLELIKSVMLTKLRISGENQKRSSLLTNFT